MEKNEQRPKGDKSSWVSGRTSNLGGWDIGYGGVSTDHLSKKFL
jgi:hypothetical protein